MKVKIESNKKTPWYVRVDDYSNENMRTISRIMTIIAILVYFLSFRLSYVYFKNDPKPYEEAWDVEFRSYVIGKLEDIAIEVFDENMGIEHDKLQEFVSKYSIEYTEQGLVFWYCLDKEQTISEYQSKTGKNPFISYSDSEKEFDMMFEISEKLGIVSRKTSLEISQTCEEYEEQHSKEIILEAFLFGLCIEIVLMLIYLAIMFTLLILEFIAERWKRKNKNLNAFIIEQ